jgi:hypothetical protein
MSEERDDERKQRETDREDRQHHGQARLAEEPESWSPATRVDFPNKPAWISSAHSSAVFKTNNADPQTKLATTKSAGFKSPPDSPTAAKKRYASNSAKRATRR